MRMKRGGLFVHLLRSRRACAANAAQLARLQVLGQQCAGRQQQGQQRQTTQPDGQAMPERKR